MIPPFTAAVPYGEIAHVLAAVEQILRSGRLVLGEHTEAFEAAVAEMADARYAVAVNSGSTALEIIFRALEVRNRVVLVPANTNYATAAAAIHAGAQLQLYDSGLYPDIADIQQRLTPDTAAVVVVHIGGYMSPDLPRLARMCERAGVALIEDAAHAHGSNLAGTPAGGFGYAAAWSFFATKVVSTGGEGGAITTDDPDLNRVARMCRNQGKNRDGQHVMAGNSWRMTEIGAAIGSAQLAHLHRDTIGRRTVIDRYTTGLGGHGLTFPAISGRSQVSGHKCVAVLDSGVHRAALRGVVAEHGVELARGVYEAPLHRQPILAGLNVGDGFPAADDFAGRHICLPLWRAMDHATVEQIIGAVATSIDTICKR
ncbi:DegT/DnrJ/EryC1/StrS family aminotransferase [Nocardia amamiensis]|uniref:DegT/DnrJ/EryC1/StrS family aminotransferase n=1 Tax=Nocardia amamiensis TaxID=404578 RepID=A0ABS0CUX6_9NOCA|nr:DegT/DnrJ/EryC1/StrS family aminotransferase [Nocardia amamiensis]MBF6300417.1 DegT/DnrJ/EryC1/StrS family aminotransferase [Nocardia amamiensis]